MIYHKSDSRAARPIIAPTTLPAMAPASAEPACGDEVGDDAGLSGLVIAFNFWIGKL